MQETLNKYNITKDDLKIIKIYYDESWDFNVYWFIMLNYSCTLTEACHIYNASRETQHVLE